MVVCLLLFRTMSNFKVVTKLIREDMVVEARTITRCCCENVFFIAALKEQGKKFVDAMVIDERNNRKKRGQVLVERTSGSDSALTEQLRACLRQLESEEQKPQWLNPQSVANRGSLRKAYMLYAELSADSAHPSLEALDRHINRLEDGTIVNERGFCIDPRLRPAEAAQTMECACLMVLSTYVWVNDILGGGTSVDKEFPALWGEFNTLTGEAEKGCI